MITPSSNLVSHPGHALHGQVQVPGDKSISHRALMLSAIAQGRSSIKGLLMGADNLATLHALSAMGVQFSQHGPQEFSVQGVGLHGLQAPSMPLDCANSGTGMRLLVGLLVGQAFDSELIGDASLSRRPMRRIVEPLQTMGAHIQTSNAGTPPIMIKGGATLRGIDYTLPVASAQVKSCLLFAGLYAQGTTLVTEPAITRDHTERMLQAFHYPLRLDHQRVSLLGGHPLQATTITVPGDISSAAFFMVAASITPGSRVLLKNVGINPTRTGVIDILRRMGANITLRAQREAGHEPVADIEVCYAPLRGVDIPANLVPLAIDEFPALFIAAAAAKGRTRLSGAEELRVKESDRLEAMAQGLQTLGIEALPHEAGIEIVGGQLQGGSVHSHGDHRIAMAFVVAGCVATGPVYVKDCANIETSFPGFIHQASLLGMHVVSEELPA